MQLDIKGAEMTRDELLKKICPRGTCDCGDDYESCNCDDCNRVLEEWLYDYSKHVIEQYKADTNLKDTIRDIHDNVAKEMYCKGIDDFANWLVEQGILGNRCISDGEITDYGKVYAKKYKEQLKAGDKNEWFIHWSKITGY